MRRLMSTAKTTMHPAERCFPKLSIDAPAAIRQPHQFSWYYTGGTKVTEQIVYASPCATDGSVYPDIGWSLDNDTLTLKLPDGRTLQRIDGRFAAVAGPVAIPEHYYATSSGATVAITKVAVRMP